MEEEAEKSVQGEKEEPKEWLLQQLAGIVRFLEQIENWFDRQVMASYLHEFRRMMRALADCNCGAAMDCRFICKYKTDEILTEKKQSSETEA